MRRSWRGLPAAHAARGLGGHRGVPRGPGPCPPGRILQARRAGGGRSRAVVPPLHARVLASVRRAPRVCRERSRGADGNRLAVAHARKGRCGADYRGGCWSGVHQVQCGGWYARPPRRRWPCPMAGSAEQFPDAPSRLRPFGSAAFRPQPPRPGTDDRCRRSTTRTASCSPGACFSGLQRLRGSGWRTATSARVERVSCARPVDGRTLRVVGDQASDLPKEHWRHRRRGRDH
mmetsp:Transcript_61865/g.175712  ORF Transcript_61865/g.175712 Transcript_61865/m.175712 type:complete len:232 (-) Transcript_61865:298-993(-)